MKKAEPLLYNPKFLQLPPEKRRRILTAALRTFGESEYKRASTDCIAARAGISKGLLFFYFPSKKALYLYAVQTMYRFMETQVMDETARGITDFFELLAYGARCKQTILRRCPWLMDFAVRAFYSVREDVSGDVGKLIREKTRTMLADYFSHIDTTPLQPGITLERLLEMTIWMMDGYLHSLLAEGKPLDADELLAEFDRWVPLLKRMAYKQEYWD